MMYRAQRYVWFSCDVCGCEISTGTKSLNLAKKVLAEKAWSVANSRAKGWTHTCSACARKADE